jgi:hypothetical protein
MHQRHSIWKIPQGISKLEISAGCKANLQQHILVTDNAIHLEGDIVHYEWSFDPRAKLPFMDEDFNDRIEELLNSGITTPTMNDLQHLRAKKSKLKYLWYFISFILSIVACSLVTLLIMVLWCRYPLSRLPCCGPFMMAFSLVSKVRKLDVKPIIKPKPKQRRRQPQPTEQTSDSIEMEELHPIARNVQWLAPSYVSYYDFQDEPLYDVPQPLVLQDHVYQQILEINDSLQKINEIEQSLLDFSESVSFVQKYTLTAISNSDSEQ